MTAASTASDARAANTATDAATTTVFALVKLGKYVQLCVPWRMQLEEKTYLDKSLKKKQFSQDIVFVEHRDYFFRIPQVIFDQKHPFNNKKKSFLDILSSLSKNCLPFFHFFLLQPPPYLNYIGFAAKRSPPIC